MGLMTAALVTYAAVSMYSAYQQGEQDKKNRRQQGEQDKANREQQERQFQQQNEALTRAQSDAQAKANARLTDRKRAAARSTSVKTNPLGIKNEAEVARKKLLGQ